MLTIIGLIIMGALGGMACIEIRRYQLSQAGIDEFPYPRRRLSRRIAIALLFMFGVAIVTFLPRLRPWIELAIYGGVAAMLLLGMILLLRDLRETSISVARHSAELTQEARQALRGMAETKRHDVPSSVPSSSEPPAKPYDSEG